MNKDSYIFLGFVLVVAGIILLFQPELILGNYDFSLRGILAILILGLGLYLVAENG